MLPIILLDRRTVTAFLSQQMRMAPIGWLHIAAVAFGASEPRSVHIRRVSFSGKVGGKSRRRSKDFPVAFARGWREALCSRPVQTRFTAEMIVFVPDFTDGITELTHSATELTVSVPDFTDSITDLTDAVMGLTHSAPDFTDAVASSTNGVTDFTHSIADFTDAVTPFTHSVAELTDAVTDLTRSVTELTHSAVQKATVSGEKAAFASKSTIFGALAPIAGSNPTKTNRPTWHRQTPLGTARTPRAIHCAGGCPA